MIIGWSSDRVNDSLNWQFVRNFDGMSFEFEISFGEQFYIRILSIHNFFFSSYNIAAQSIPNNVRVFKDICIKNLRNYY